MNPERERDRERKKAESHDERNNDDENKNKKRRGRKGEENCSANKKQYLVRSSHHKRDNIHEDEVDEASTDNYLALGVFDFPWLKESMISKSLASEGGGGEEEGWSEDLFLISVGDSSTRGGELMSSQCLPERTEACIDIPVEKFEESSWALEMEKW